MHDIVTIGESLGLLRAVPPDGVEMAGSLRLGVGGAESNVAIGASRLGADVMWIGRVGDDEIGRRVVRELRAENVRTQDIVDADSATALMLKEDRGSGLSRVRYYRTGSAGSRLTPRDLDPAWIAGARLVHLTGITPSLSPGAEATVWQVLSIAEQNGVPVSFDVNHRSTLTRHREPAPMYREIARRATILFAGEDEARLLVPSAEGRQSLLEGMAALGPREVMLKLAAEGCLAMIDRAYFEVPAFPVDVVDTVGAGDAFVAGYLAERVRGRSALERLRTAAFCGARACMGPGDWEHAPRRADLAAADATGDTVLR
ncbi:sugar kinase [Microbacterium phyllosphaerae]|uniref:sugar kinase n=1 Tax=Microbacterium phyllosphaerae TaxID=124798 RepID=UPI003D6587FF